MARNQKLSDLLPPELRQAQEPEQEEAEDIEAFDEDEGPEIEPEPESEQVPEPESESEPEPESEPESEPKEPVVETPEVLNLQPGYSMQDDIVYFGPQTNWQLLWSVVKGQESNVLEGLEVSGLGVLVRSTSNIRGSITQSITMIPGVRIVEVWIQKVGEKEKVFCRKLKKA